MRIEIQAVRLVRITTEPAQLIEEAGRTAYRSEDKITDDSAAEFVQMIRQRGHDSVIEHACATFHFVTDRGITHEIVRHRIASYTQESTRYCNYSKGKFNAEISVLEPSGLNYGCHEEWLAAMEDAERHYLRMIEMGAIPGQARSVLPTCLRTAIVMTANFREWLHFLSLRTSPAAHADMQRLAGLVGVVLAQACPAVFNEYAK